MLRRRKSHAAATAAPVQPEGVEARTSRRPVVAACLACAALALAALSWLGALEAATWCAAAWLLRARRRGASWLAAVLAVGLGFAAWVRLVSLWVSAIAPYKPAQMEWQTVRLGALLLGCAVVLALAGFGAWRARGGRAR